MTATDDELESLRDEIDAIDDALHDLIMKRVQVTGRIGEIKLAAGGGRSFFRPGREALVLRRLLARHRGSFPSGALVRVWREIMGATLGLQGPFVVAVFMPEDQGAYMRLARDHFGTEAPMTSFARTGQVFAALREGAATVGILPWPHESHSDPWWRHLIAKDETPPRIVAGLPFIGGARDRGDAVRALVVARHPAEPTGRDRSFLAVETKAGVSRPRLLEALGALLPSPVPVAVLRGGGVDGGDLHLVEVEGLFAADDPRLSGLARKGQRTILAAMALGGYAEPVSAADLGVEAAAQ